MRVVVTGASGNAGTSVLDALAADGDVQEILALARRRPAGDFPKTEWRTADIERDDLESLFRGADCVVHLAWAIQPSHDLAALRHTNVHGSERVFRAVAEADVPALVYASSVGAYSPGPKHRTVDESWPTEGTPTSFYARHKAEVERLLDHFQVERPEMRVVRLRPGLIFKRSSGEEQRRYFLGPFFPRILARTGRDRVRPGHGGSAFPGCALARRRRGIPARHRRRRARRVQHRGGAGSRPGDARPRAQRPKDRASRGPRPGAIAASWRLRLQPTPPGWLDMGLSVPIMDTTRAREILRWEPRHSSLEAIRDVLAGMAGAEGEPTPPLEAARH